MYLHAVLFLVSNRASFDRILDVSNGIPFFTPLITRIPSVLLVHHVHGGQWFSEFPKPIAWFGAFLELRVVPFIYRNRRVIAVSESTKANLEAHGYRRNQVVVVHNGVTAPPVCREIRVNPSLRLIYLGRLKKYKRVDLAIRLVAQLRKEFPDLCLDIVGEGDNLGVGASVILSCQIHAQRLQGSHDVRNPVRTDAGPEVVDLLIEIGKAHHLRPGG